MSADPRIEEPGERGMPGSLDDTEENLPGDQSPPTGDALPDDEQDADEQDDDD